MRSHRSALAFLVVALLIGPSHRAEGFDDKRQGFELGFGAGVGSVFSLASSSGWSIRGLQTELRIGHGISDRWSIHYSGRQFFFSKDGAFITYLFPTVAAAYYPRPKAPTYYLTGGIGVGGGGGFGRDSDAGAGVAYLGAMGVVGIGYELEPHVGMELTGGLSHPPSSRSVVGNAALTLNVLKY